MKGWRRVLDHLIRLRLQRTSTDPSARLWTISTEFLVEAGPDEGTRFGGA